MRVLHVSQPGSAGVARVVAQVSAAQAEAGFKVAVAGPQRSWLDATLRSLPVEYFPWAASRSPNIRTLSESRALRKILQQWSPDLLHLHSAKSGLAGRIAARGLQESVIFQPHAWSFAIAQSERARLSDKIVSALAVRWERIAAAVTDHYIFVSDSEYREGLDKGVEPRSYSVIANGVDPVQWDHLDRENCREALGLGSMQSTVVFVGRLTEQKGVDLLVDLWPRVERSVPGAQLIIVGDGPDRETLYRRAHGIASIRWVGDSDDPGKFLKAADVAVFPSRWEGMAIAPLEAMSCSLSVVGFDVGGLGSSLANECGAAVRPGDVRELESALVARLVNARLAREEGRASRKQVESRFSAGEMTSTYVYIAKQVIASRR